MSAPRITTPELEAMCNNARRVASICGTLGLGDPRVSELEPLFNGYRHFHALEEGEYDPDTHPYIWELS